MVRTLTCATIVVLLIVSVVPRAHGEELSAKYLQGRWVIDAKDCSSSESEYVVFRENRTFEDTRDGKTEIVGFWKISRDPKDSLDLHMVTSPGFFQDVAPEMQQYEGDFGYAQARIIAFNIRRNSFEAIGVLGSQVKRAVAVRCK